MQNREQSDAKKLARNSEESQNTENESYEQFSILVPQQSQQRTQPYTNATHNLQGQAGSTLRVPRNRSKTSDYDKLIEEAELPELARKPSILLPQLQNSEKKFFDFVYAGNVNTVKEFLIENHGFNINCTNFQGVSALQIAIQIHSEAMVEFLLAQRSIDVGDCVLHAIRDNQPKILEIILNHLQQTAPGLEYVGATHSTDFPDHITPLILAAQCGNYEIIGMLIARGHNISYPHKPDCFCAECRLELEQDDLLHAETRRISIYKAITNPAYICHSSNDPILAAFQLSHELKKCAIKEPEFRSPYLTLANHVSRFAVDLIGCCRSTEEMELILKQKTGSDTPAQFIFPRLVLAMDYKQKEFVAHQHTQQILETAWHGNWYEWKRLPAVIRYLYPFIRLPMLPIITIMCIILPKNNAVTHWKLPINKLLSHTAAYVLFLILIFCESNLDKTDQKRGPPDSGIEAILLIYVLGYTWSCIRMCIMQGPHRYFKMMWNWHDWIMIVLFACTFIFWFVSLVDVRNNDQRNLPRKYWHHLDPILIAEGTFAIATIMAFFRVLFLMQLNYYLGPLQISLGKMSADIAKFIVIFTVIIIAFTAGLTRYYQYYGGMVQEDTVSGIKTVQVNSFVDFASTLKTFFWALFCMAPLESANVIIENLPGETENTTIINKHGFTETVGYIAFACFEVLTVIVILNMLIATMSNTFQRVNNNVDIEWTFGKTEVYIEYMIQTTLPSPFNLIPTASGIGDVFEWVKVLGTKPTGKAARCSPTHCCYIDTEMEESMTHDFPVLMSQLVQRYFRDKENTVANENNKNEVETIKQELQELKDLFKQLIIKESFNGN